MGVFGVSAGPHPEQVVREVGEDLGDLHGRSLEGGHEGEEAKDEGAEVEAGEDGGSRGSGTDRGEGEGFGWGDGLGGTRRRGSTLVVGRSGLLDARGVTVGKSSAAALAVRVERREGRIAVVAVEDGVLDALLLALGSFGARVLNRFTLTGRGALGRRSLASCDRRLPGNDRAAEGQQSA